MQWLRSEMQRRLQWGMRKRGAKGVFHLPPSFASRYVSPSHPFGIPLLYRRLRRRFEDDKPPSLSPSHLPSQPSLHLPSQPLRPPSHEVSLWKYEESLLSKSPNFALIGMQRNVVFPLCIINVILIVQAVLLSGLQTYTPRSSLLFQLKCLTRGGVYRI